MQLCPNLWLLRLHPQVLEPHGIHGPTLKSMAPDATALYIHQRALLWKRFVIAGLWTKAPPASHLGQKRAEVTTSPNLTTRHFRDIMIPWCPFMNHHLKALRVDVAMIHSLIKNEYNDIICISAAFWNESNEHHSANLPSSPHEISTAEKCPCKSGRCPSCPLQAPSGRTKVQGHFFTCDSTTRIAAA